MNYLKVYCNLIRKAETRTPPEGYTEKHHIFPKSIFGNRGRVVVLTAREHYIAHSLLERICIKRYGLKDQRTIKMITAFWCMNNQNTKNEYFNSYLYESSRMRYIDSKIGVKLTDSHRQKISEAARGKNNSMYGKNHTSKTIEKISESKKKLGEEVLKEIASNAGKKSYEMEVGIHKCNSQQLSEYGKIGGQKVVELGLGVHSLTKEQRIENSRKAGIKNRENKTGFCGRSKEKMSEDGRKGGKIGGKIGGKNAQATLKNKKLGIYGLTKEQLSQIGKKVSAQRWVCLETGYITNAGALSTYQKKRGIDTSKRMRLE